MSRKLQAKNKALITLETKTSKEVWNKDKKGNFVLNNDFDYYGKVEKGTSAFITMTNRKGKNTKFIEDTHRLSKKTKNEIVATLNTGKNSVVYLVKKK